MTAPLRLRAATPASATLSVERLGGREVVLASLEHGPRRGAMTPADGAVLAAAAERAVDSRLPLVLFLASSGADAAEGVAALAAWGEVARALSRCSGVVPVLAAVTGPTISGSALLVGLADHVVMTRDAYAFVSGPVPVRVMTGVHVGVSELGGPGVHDRATGTASVMVDDRDAAVDAITELVSYLPGHADAAPPLFPTSDPPDRPTPEAGACIPEHSTGSYDVRDVITAISDDGHLMELRAGWAPNMVTALATIGGRPIGYVANQPLAIAGTLDIAASQKAARFVAFCDAFNLPIITLVDTPGFYPGKDLEWRGMIRHGAQMAFAYARATVPRMAVVLRKSYGGAYIVMDSKSIGNDVYLAWPTAELAVMGASQAAEILHRRATPEERAERVSEYEERHLNPYEAADRGYVDAVIDPADTRTALAESLEVLTSKRERLVARRHDNTPL
jgi:acetyl-CoA carboxylase carboxyltransferase component